MNEDPVNSTSVGWNENPPTVFGTEKVFSNFPDLRSMFFPSAQMLSSYPFNMLPDDALD